jgi:preprotein translocase subunit YajC
MQFNLITPAFAQATEGATKGGAPMWPMLLVLFAVFYFFIIRPQQRKQKESKNLLQQIAKGDRIVTIGGISGVIQNVKEKRDVKSDDDIVVIKTGEARIEMIRSSISRVVSEDGTVATVEKK